VVSLTGLDLYNNQGALVKGHDINLAATGAPVGSDRN
jgi:hypothetical protein